MIIARQLFKLQNLSKTVPMFKFSEFAESNQDRVPRLRLKKVAIILSGSGVYDGSEITETVSLMVHLNKLRVDFQCFAPNQNQLHVINHITGETTTETRNVLVESARIARGEVKDIVELKGDDYQAVIIPGGFGSAKNLSNYAVEGANFTVHDEVTRALKEFHTLKKPIGAMCISPLLLAKVFQAEKPKITMGRVDPQDAQTKYWPHSDAINVAETLGAQHQQRNADKFQIDFENKLITTPAMMFNGFSKYSTTFDGIGHLVKIVEQIALGQAVKIDALIEKKDFGTNGYRKRTDGNNFDNRTEGKYNNRTEGRPDYRNDRNNEGYEQKRPYRPREFKRDTEDDQF